MARKHDMRKYIAELIYKIESEKVLQRVWKILEREYASQILE